MKRLFAISWAMPPLVLPRSIQVARMLHHLGGRGWDISVLCAEPRQVRGVVYDYWLEKIYSAFQKLPSPVPEAFPAVRVLFRMFPGLRVLPDEHKAWMPKAVQKARTFLKQKSVSALISFAQPWTDHLIGLTLKKESGLPWVVHFSDPWVDNPFLPLSGLLRKMNVKYEEDVIHNADALIFVTENARQKTMDRHPRIASSKSFVIPHCLDFQLCSQMDKAKQKSKKLRFIHTGYFYKGVRTPLPFLKSLHALRASMNIEELLEVEFIGPNAQDFQAVCRELGLEGVVHCSGPKTFEECLSKTNNSDVILIFEGVSSEKSPFLPSKTIESLLFKKTIFGITSEGSPTMVLLKNLGCPFCLPDNEEKIQAIIIELLQRKKMHSLDLPSSCSDILNTFNVENLGKKMDEILHFAMKQQSS